MKRTALPSLALRLALGLGLALTVAPGGAQAQNFFERLFGIVPDRPAPPPINVAPTIPRGGDTEEPQRRAAPAPVQARPVAIKAPSEETVVNRDLKQDGSNGALRIERTARGELRVKLTLAGRRAAQSVDTCTIPIGGPDGAPLVAMGRPEGTPRYQLPDPVCPMQFDILDEAVMVKGPSEICVFEALTCQSDPTGMWGLDPVQIVPRAREFESARASADKAVRENYKALVQRARPESVRPIVAEQAAFSADRETMCRSYAREGTTSFCNAKFSEARALVLGTRLGVTTTASVGGSESRSRRPRPDPSGLPSTDELMQRRALDDDTD